MRRPLVVLTAVAALSCSGTQRPRPRDPNDPVPVLQLCLAGEAAARGNEYSGLAWHGDELYLLPQWSHAGLARARAAPGFTGPYLYRIPGARVRAWVDGVDRRPIAPERVPIDLRRFAEDPDWQGFEALAFDGDEAALAIELGDHDRMAGLFVTGTLDASRGLVLRPQGLRLEVPQRSENNSYEALVRSSGSWLALFELNGMDTSCASQALRFHTAADTPSVVAVESLPYRITDATPPDAQGRFWATQYSYRDPNDDGECRRSIRAVGCFTEAVDCDVRGGATRSVERLIELRDEGIAVHATGRRIMLLREDRPRNWEGIARLDGRGFLIVTDEWPRSILGFVPDPDRPLPTPAAPCPTE